MVNADAASSSSSSSSSSDNNELPPFPFPTPLKAPPPRASMQLLKDWLLEIAPYVNHLKPKDCRVYELVRGRKNARDTYARKVTNPDTGELARLHFCDKAAVSIS